MIDNTNLTRLDKTVYPETSTDQVVDKTTGKSLEDIILEMQAQIDRLTNQGFHGNFGNCKKIPSGITKLEDIYEPGMYYLITTEMQAMTDKPFNNGNAGYLEVINRDIGDRIQSYTPNNHIYFTGERFHRVLKADNTVSPWSMECNLQTGDGSPQGVLTGGIGRFYFDTTNKKMYISLAVDAWQWVAIN